MDVVNTYSLCLGWLWPPVGSKETGVPRQARRHDRREDEVIRLLRSGAWCGWESRRGCGKDSGEDSGEECARVRRLPTDGLAVKCQRPSVGAWHGRTCAHPPTHTREGCTGLAGATPIALFPRRAGPRLPRLRPPACRHRTAGGPTRRRRSSRSESNAPRSR